MEKELELEFPKSKVYIKIDDRNRIIRCEGGFTTPSDLTDWILIDEGTGDKYNLCQTHYFEKSLFEQHGIPVYKYEDEECVERTQAEIQADIDAIHVIPSENDKISKMELALCDMELALCDMSEDIESKMNEIEVALCDLSEEESEVI